MKKIIASLIAIATCSFATDIDVQQWERPWFLSDTNVTQTYTFTAGSVGILDCVQVSPQVAYTNSVSLKIITNSGFTTNNYATSVGLTNGILAVLFPRTDHYLLEQGDQIIVTYGSPDTGKFNKLQVWMRDVLK